MKDLKNLTEKEKEFIKKQISYDRQLTVCGKEKADNVYFFAMKGFCACEKSNVIEFAKFCMENAKVWPNKGGKYSINENSLQAGWTYDELYQEFKTTQQDGK